MHRSSQAADQAQVAEETPLEDMPGLRAPQSLMKALGEAEAHIQRLRSTSRPKVQLEDAVFNDVIIPFKRSRASSVSPTRSLAGESRVRRACCFLDVIAEKDKLIAGILHGAPLGRTVAGARASVPTSVTVPVVGLISTTPSCRVSVVAFCTLQYCNSPPAPIP